MAVGVGGEPCLTRLFSSGPSRGEGGWRVFTSDHVEAEGAMGEAPLPFFRDLKAQRGFGDQRSEVHPVGAPVAGSVVRGRRRPVFPSA